MIFKINENCIEKNPIDDRRNTFIDARNVMVTVDDGRTLRILNPRIITYRISNAKYDVDFNEKEDNSFFITRILSIELDEGNPMISTYFKHYTLEMFSTVPKPILYEYKNRTDLSSYLIERGRDKTFARLNRPVVSTLSEVECGLMRLVTKGCVPLLNYETDINNYEWEKVGVVYEKCEIFNETINILRFICDNISSIIKPINNGNVLTIEDPEDVSCRLVFKHIYNNPDTRVNIIKSPTSTSKSIKRVHGSVLSFFDNYEDPFPEITVPIVYKRVTFDEKQDGFGITKATVDNILNTIKSSKHSCLIVADDLIQRVIMKGLKDHDKINIIPINKTGRRKDEIVRNMCVLFDTKLISNVCVDGKGTMKALIAMLVKDLNCEKVTLLNFPRSL